MQLGVMPEVPTVPWGLCSEEAWARGRGEGPTPPHPPTPKGNFLPQEWPGSIQISRTGPNSLISPWNEVGR